MNYCKNNEITNPCKSELNREKILSYLNTACFEKQDCEIDITKIRDEIANTTSATSKQCLGETANFFVQIPCTFHLEELAERRVEGLLIACMGVFIAMFFVVYVDYLKSIFKNLNIEWDVKTITAGDYSVELDITQKMWHTFLNDIYKPELSATKLA